MASIHPVIFRLLRLAALLGILVGLSPIGSLRAEVTGYLDAIDDMPLMDGLRETGEGGIVFDKPAGRIVRAEASGTVSPKAVHDFYLSALPPLGWTRIERLELFNDILVYRREGERLEIQITPKGANGAVVRFSIEPE